MRTVAAFDFDGTLSRGDSLFPFLLRLVGGPRLAHAGLKHAKALALVGLGRGSRDETKERVIAHLLADHDAGEIETLGKTFAEDLLATRMLPEPMSRLAWHQDHGHECVLVSASLDVYLQPLAEQLGFRTALTTTLEIEDGRATGRLVGGNVRAEAKAQQLRAWLTETGLTDLSEVDLWAYGNSEGDHEMLALSQHPHWVTKAAAVEPWRR